MNRWYTGGVVEETAIGGEAREFPKTRWTLILSSRDGEAATRNAMESLLGAYWKPLYFYARRKGLSIEQAKDTVQGFCLHLLELDFLKRLDPKKGRFRGYLRTAFDHFRFNQHEAASAQKRGGGLKTVALDFDVAERDIAAAPEAAETAYDREWALGVMDRALQQLRREFEDGTRRGPFDVAMKFFGFGEQPTYEDAAGAAGMSVSQLKAFIHRARARFREFVRREVAHTVSDAGETDAEVDELLKALGA